MRVVIVFANYCTNTKSLVFNEIQGFYKLNKKMKKCDFIELLAFFGIIEVYIFLRYAFIW